MKPSNWYFEIMKLHGVSGKILDFGAGIGELIKLLAQNGGLELSAADILDRPHDLPEHVTWYHQDLNEQLSVDGHFDAVICSEVIEHLENPRAIFRNIGAVLKRNGKLILTMPNQEKHKVVFNSYVSWSLCIVYGLRVPGTHHGFVANGPGANLSRNGI